jgi:hypothetical protein
MKKLLVIWILCCFSGLTFGQSSNSGEKDIIIPKARIHSVAGHVTNGADGIDYIQEELPLFSQSEYSLVLTDSRESLTGKHYSYDVYFRNIPIHGVQVRLHTDLSGNILWASDNSTEVTNYQSVTSINLAHYKWIQTANGWELAEVVASMDDKHIKEVYIDGDLYMLEENKLYFRQPDSLVHAQVFLVNPLNSAQRSYGSPYIDSSDQDVPVLNAERKWVTMNTLFENDTFWLKTDRYYFGEVSDPETPLTYSVTDTFSFTRSQEQFEDVNVFYHVTQMSDYVEQLGFETALADTLLIDAHGYGGGDFSSFNYSVTPLELEFGIGGVDDGEDGEIVVHEFAHSLSHIAGANSFSGTRDRGAMEEGNADYFSAAYSKAYTDFAWKQMFNWDGHNPFWGGISIGRALKYPVDMQNSTNHDREMWSTPLMCIHDRIGRSATDSLVLEHLYYQFKNATIPEMAHVLLTVDSMLWQGKYHHDIRNCFAIHDVLANTPTPVAFDRLFKAKNTLAFSEGANNAIVESRDLGEFNYLIYNNLGQKIDSGKASGVLVIDPAEIISGIYFVQLNIGNSTTYLKLIRN